jgi:phenylacetate-coenzyme A ligase PaaK-like adenylate-forming protein
MRDTNKKRINPQLRWPKYTHSVDAKLKDIVCYAYYQSPFYKWFYTKYKVDVSRFRGLEDYERLPILNKEDILAFMQEYGTQDMQRAWCVHDLPVITLITTGTLGKRMSVPYTQNDITFFCTNVLLALLQYWGYNGGPLNGIVPDSSQDPVSIILNAMAAATNGRIFHWSEIHKGLDGFQSLVYGETVTFMSLPSLCRFIKMAHSVAILNSLNVRYILTLVAPSELRQGLHLKLKKRLQNVNLIPVYGSAEMGLVGGATPNTFRDAQVHILQPGCFHIIDNNGALRDIGTGELLYTSLGREAFPFIKYRVGDIVTIEEMQGGNCRRSKLIRFERRSKPLIVKIPDAAGYFIDILKIEEIVKVIVPFSQIMCVHGQYAQGGDLFVGIFVATPQKLSNVEDVKCRIIKEIILNHVPSQKIEEDGMPQLMSRFTRWFPIFFIDTTEMPKEPDAAKPRLFLDLMAHTDVYEVGIYRNLLSKLPI